MNDNMVAAATTDLFGFLLNKPSGKIYFNKRKKRFMADGTYIHLFKKEFSNISETNKLIQAKAAEEKDADAKAAAEKAAADKAAADKAAAEKAAADAAAAKTAAEKAALEKAAAEKAGGR